MPPRLIVAILATLTAALVSLGAAGPALAHDELVSSNPSSGAQVPTVPPTVTLRFDEAALAIGTKIVVTGPAGEVQVGQASVVGKTVTEQLQPGAPAGRYTVDWRVTSVDGHPVSGTFAFTATAVGAGQAAPSSAASGAAASGAAASVAAPSSVSTAGSSVPWFLVAASALLLVLIGAAAVWSRRRSAAAPSQR